MDTQEYLNIYRHEETHFFYKATHLLVLQLIRAYKSTGEQLNILDAGCGTGLLASRLKMFGKVEGLDFHPEAIKYAKKRGINARLGSINKLPYKNNSFDIITCIDVLYHKEVNDSKALQEINRTLKPGGILILRVPANKWLKPKHDEFVHTRERYSRNQIESKIINGGFEIEKVTYVHTILLPLSILNVYKEQLFESKIESTIQNLPKWVNDLFYWVLKIEVDVLKYFNLPFGLGLTVVARKLSPN